MVYAPKGNFANPFAWEWIEPEGTADFYPACGETVPIQAGDVVVARAGEKDGMTNNSDKNFIMIGIAGPTPIGFIPHKHGRR